MVFITTLKSWKRIKKIIATCVKEVDICPLDCFSISHVNSGIISYYISFWLFAIIFKMDSLLAILLSYLCCLVGGLIWEFFENICIVDMKKNKREDSPVNSLMDVLLVFFGSIIGAYTYDLWIDFWIFNIVLLAALFESYGITRIITEKNIFGGS